MMSKRDSVIEALCWESILVNMNSNKVDECSLFHYTRSEIKKHIVKEKELCFQATQLRDFLDKNESYHVFEPYYHVCGKLYNDGEFNRRFYDLLRSVRPDNLKMHDDAWIICFSSNGNSIYMKERYAPKNGCIIGVNRTAFDFSFPNEYGIVLVSKVSYRSNKLEAELTKIIKRIYNGYEQDKNDNVYGDMRSLNKATKLCIINHLSMYNYCYKSSDYSGEEEIRVLFKVKKDFEKWKCPETGVIIELVKIKSKNKLQVHIDNRYQYGVSKSPVSSDNSKYNKSFISGHEINLQN